MRPSQQPSYVINQVEVKGQQKYMVMHEVDVFSPEDQLTTYEKNADVICLLYDGSDPNSFAYCAKLYLVSGVFTFILMFRKLTYNFLLALFLPYQSAMPFCRFQNGQI